MTKDTPAELKDDFALYVNKDWILKAEIPDGLFSASLSMDINLEVSEKRLALMKDDSLTGHDADLVHKLYKLITDWDYRNALGVSPVLPYIKAIEAIDSEEALYTYLCSNNNLLRSVPLNTYFERDPKDPSFYVAYVEPSVLPLGTPEAYLDKTAFEEEQYNTNRQLALYMLQRLGYSEEEAIEKYDNAIAYETLLATSMLSGNEDDLIDCTADELMLLTEAFPIMDILATIDLSGGRHYFFSNPGYMAALQNIYTNENIPLIRDWLTVKTALAVCDLLDRETMQATQAINNASFGVSGQTNEDFSASLTVADLLVIPLDNLYIKTYCSAEQRQEITELINEILAYYRIMMESEDWLSETTKKAAIEKLDNIRVNAVYPDKLGDWSALDFAGPEEGGNLLEATFAIKNFKRSLQALKISAPVDTTVWNQLERPASSIAGEYTVDNNTITVTAGFLTGDQYYKEMTYEQKLAGVGTVIAHEITHAFDTKGSNYDKDGLLTNWWTDEDMAIFQARSDKLAAWYDGFIPYEGAVYPGKNKKAEAIADMGSMKCMLGLAKQYENFDYDAFFRHFASTMREQSLPEIIELKVWIDNHPLSCLRINATLAQFDEFLNFYGIKEGDGMYIAPEDRVAVW